MMRRRGVSLFWERNRGKSTRYIAEDRLIGRCRESGLQMTIDMVDIANIATLYGNFGGFG